jgi:hypothetical protein
MLDPIPIDWTLYSTLVPDTIICRCGEMFWSHTQYVSCRNGRSHHKIYSRKKCPRCGRDDNAREIRGACYIRNINGQ